MGVKLHIGGAADRAGRILPQNVDIGRATEAPHGQAGIHWRLTAAVIAAAEDKPVSIDKVAKRRHGAVTPDSAHNKPAPFLWGSFFHLVWITVAQKSTESESVLRPMRGR